MLAHPTLWFFYPFKYLAISATISLLLFLPGCRPYYGFGSSGIDPIVFVKPVYADTARVSTYAGGSFTHTPDSAYGHWNESNMSGKFYLARTQSEKYYTFSYGAFGFMGKYHVAEIPGYRGYKSYYGGGLSGEFCFNIPFGSTDIRLFGLKGSMYYEDGDFTAFRTHAARQELIRGVTQSRMAYNISLTSGYEYRFAYQHSIGLDGSMGVTNYWNDDPADLTFSANIHYTHKRYMGYFLLAHSVFGLGGEYAIGVSYRL